ncbi:MAG: BatD family protein [Pseudomonas sp.]|nr:BatD family protein [Pseudomonas sp.]
MNRAKITFYISCLLLLCLSSVQAATFTATVDRSQLNAGESIELILESDDTTQFLAPDLTPLTPFFELLASQQINRFSSIAGEQRPITQWRLTLLPKQTGFVIIPPLTLGELQSAPINLYIKEFKQQPTAKLEPVYIDTQLDQEWVYVQAQAVLTLRIYHAIPLFADSNLTPLLLDNARVEPLGKPRTFEQHINGVRHGVIEVSYAIFPQQSGLIEIPEQTFSATLAGHDPHSLTPFQARPGQRIEVKSARIPLQVKAIPSSYPADALWLPAKHISLEQRWTANLDAPISTGSAATRLLTLRAEGLPSSQLPTLVPHNSSAYKVYVDKPSFSHQYTEQGLLSSSEERQAFVFEVAGQHNLDAVQLPWWNTSTDQLEYAKLAEQPVLVTAQPLKPPSNEPRPSDTDLTPSLLDIHQLRFWHALSVFFIILNLLAFTLWWRARHQPAVVVASSNGPSPRNLQDDLKRACLSNDPNSTRQALDAWARQHPESLVDMAARDSTLSNALDALNSALYSESYSDWQGQALWQAIQQLSFGEQLSNVSENQLPPLYPP